MSPGDTTVGAEECVALAASRQAFDAHPNRELHLGSLAISRALPVKDRRLVGPWCFLDRFGPLTFAGGSPMDVAPHPHIGLQTVTWLLAGEVAHDDSLGGAATLEPGAVNVMTASGGIAHAEQTPRANSGRLDGVQLWTALPDAHRHGQGDFAHVREVPTAEWPGGVVRVFAGTLDRLTSPAPCYSELVGADLQVHAGRTLAIPLNAAYEHAVLVLGGDCRLDGQALQERMLYYLGTRRTEASFSSRTGGRVLLIGGPPFPEAILMWWNFVARTPEEIAQARLDWEEHRRFGEVAAYRGPRLSAPPLTRLARPNALS